MLRSVSVHRIEIRGGSTVQRPNSSAPRRANENHGTHKTAHPGTGRGHRKDFSRLLFSHDRPSRTGIQRSLRENATAVAAAVLHAAIGLFEHLVRLGCD